MMLIPRPRRRAESMPVVRLTLPEFLFLFGRKPSDWRWIESADRLEKLNLRAYLIERVRHGRGA